jgi:large subunit ribosomal protein L23
MSVSGYQKIKGFISTEKSSQQLSFGKYHIKVDSSCNKSEIASLVKRLFAVDVENVNIVNAKSKAKRFKGVSGKRSSYKKAVVTLKEGQSINFA